MIIIDQKIPKTGFHARYAKYNNGSRLTIHNFSAKHAGHFAEFNSFRPYKNRLRSKNVAATAFQMSEEEIIEHVIKETI